MTTAVKLKRHDNGLIAVDQHEFGFINVSYNPDDDRFYVSTFEHDTLATFANNARGFANAVYYARRKYRTN